MIRFLFLASLLVFALPATAVVSQSDIFGHTFAYRPDDGKSSEYDPAGNRIAHTAFTNQTTRYAYDLDGKRLLATDLAATEDVQLTAAIQAQAAALNNNPVQIHNWVRNSIEFLPSYRSIQGAECMPPIQKC